MVSGVSGVSSSGVRLHEAIREGWWSVVAEDEGPRRIVAGPFPDRVDVALGRSPQHGGPDEARPVYGVRRPDGRLELRPSPEDKAWMAHVGAQLDRLPDGWDAKLSEDDPLITLVVEVVAALAESGLPLLDSTGTDGEVGGACLTPEPGLGGIVVTWRQHDRMSLHQVHGAAVDGFVQEVMNRALADVLELRGFMVDAFGGASGHIVRSSPHRQR